jgi:hypothetical protein
MPLYGIDGLEPIVTALSTDGTRVRTSYRTASGELVELVQQRNVAEPPVLDIQSTRRAFTLAGRAGAVAERPTAVAAAPRTLSRVRGAVRLTLQTAAEAPDLNALVARLRVD